MSTMNAVTFTIGAPENLKIEQLPIPAPGPVDVLVKVNAAGINPVDWKTRKGVGVNGFFDADKPMVLGWDIAGVVEAVGAGVTRFNVGDRVFGMPHFPRPASAYAEYVVAPSRQLALTPDSLTDVEAAGLPLAGLTAWQALVDTAKIGSGTRVLIHAGAGGVGHLAIQIAKARGAEVWTTASAAKLDLVRKLGADHPIDYNVERFEDVATDMDVVLDLIGGNGYAERSVACLKPGGLLIVVPSPGQVPTGDLVDSAGVTATWILVEPDYASLDQLARMVTDGTLRVLVDRTEPLANAQALHEACEQGRTVGKLVLTTG